MRLLTFGHGYTAKALARRLSTWHVTATARSPEQAAELTTTGVTPILASDRPALAAALRSGDTTAMQTGATQLGDDMKRITASLTEVGARTVRLEAAVQRADDTRYQVQGTLSDIENTDLPKATMELQLQEVAYHASLAATSRVLQPSLVDFLR